MQLKKLMVIFLITFIGMCGVISVDKECQLTTGQGGKLGLELGRTMNGNVSICFFGIEGEIP